MELEIFHMTTGGSHRSRKINLSPNFNMTNMWSNASMSKGESQRRANIKKRCMWFAHPWANNFIRLITRTEHKNNTHQLLPQYHKQD